MIAILLPVHPNWMAMIMNGDKGTEVRRNAPKDWIAYLKGKGPKPKPKTVYLYCTEEGQTLVYEQLPDTGFGGYEGYGLYGDKRNLPNYGDIQFLNGKVVGKFTLEEVEEINQDYHYDNFQCIVDERWYCTKTLTAKELYAMSCLGLTDLDKYLKPSINQKFAGYAWHISNLEVFDEPRELSSLKKANLPNPKKIKFANWTAHYYWFLGSYTTKHGQMTCEEIVKAVDDLISVKRAPQSWCYVSDGELDKIWL